MPKKTIKTHKRATAKRARAPKPKPPDLMTILGEQISKVESRFQEGIKQLETKATEFLDRVEFESRVSDLQTRVLESIPKMEAELKSIETRLTRAIQKPELETKLAQMEKKISGLTTEIEALKGRIKDLEVPDV